MCVSGDLGLATRFNTEPDQEGDLRYITPESLREKKNDGYYFLDRADTFSLALTGFEAVSTRQSQLLTLLLLVLLSLLFRGILLASVCRSVCLCVRVSGFSSQPVTDFDASRRGFRHTVSSLSQDGFRQLNFF